MSNTPTSADFDSAYENYKAPWVIGEPQSAIVKLEKDGWIRGSVLDVGCGAGEHTIHLARLGYEALGVDASIPAIELARANAERQGVPARFAVADALKPGSEQYDTVLDSALFHIFDAADRKKYVDSLRTVCKIDGLVHMLALSDEGPGFGPEVSDKIIREAFSSGWHLEDLCSAHYVALATAEHHVTELGLRRGQRVELPAWQARVRRV
ncbi:MAG: class I SAM-dependent methyltransferase [Balneolaceae bacterium]